MRHLLFLALIAAAAALGGCGNAGASTGADLAISPDAADPARITVRLTGPAVRSLRERFGPVPAAADVESVLRIALKPLAGSPPPPPMLASIAFRDGEAVLTPQVSLTRGMEYRATFDGGKLSPPQPDLVRDYSVPLDTSASTSRVADFFPSMSPLPSNVFRFYVWFTEPMAQGQAFKHIRLLDPAGKPMPMALHEVELWSQDHRRLTLWISPGRTKTALGITDVAGHVLQPYQRYTLVIGAGLPDQRGRPLAEDRRITIQTGPPDTVQPCITAWRVEAPVAGGRGPLLVRFDETLDRPLLNEALSVTGPDGRTVAGSGAPLPDGKAWQFRPAAPWQAGNHTLMANGELDDLAGNSLLRPFESVSGKAPLPSANAPSFHRAFAVRAAAKP